LIYTAHRPRTTRVLAIPACNRYYGRTDVPIGAYKGAFDWWLRGPYVDDVVARFPGPIRNASESPDAVTVCVEVCG
jgi:hypothetical protein